MFALVDNQTLRAYTIAGGNLLVAGTLTLPAVGTSLFVGGGVATIGAEGSFLGGFMTANVANPASLALLSGIDNTGIAGRAVVLNGSGLGVAVGAPGGVFNFRGLDVLDMRDPTNTAAFLSRFTLPSAPEDVRIAGGMAFVAGGTSGLVVVNYAGFDSAGIAPTVSITAEAVDADPATPGIQVVEGRPVRIVPTVGDDVQIRSLELLVNGSVVSTDASFPFDLTAIAPLLSAGGASMNVQVRATDTGGNATLSNVLAIGVVADTFPPQLASINIAEGERRFFVRSIDLAFDEPLDVAKLSTSGITLVGAGADGSFGTSDDVSMAVRIDSRSQGQAVSLVLQGILPSGNYRLAINPSIIADRAGNVLAAAITRDFSIRPASDIHAVTGVPEIPTAPSANPDQQIGISVPFNPANARADFRVIDASGNVTRLTVGVTRFDTTQGIAFFTVPMDAVTGDTVVYSQVGAVRTDFADGTFPLQILPTIVDVQVESVTADGTSATLLIAGTGL
ncbi:MAG: Ig-like domain-containing protein, partial [Vicinamibacterales bacterium]